MHLCCSICHQIFQGLHHCEEPPCKLDGFVDFNRDSGHEMFLLKKRYVLGAWNPFFRKFEYPKPMVRPIAGKWLRCSLRKTHWAIGRPTKPSSPGCQTTCELSHGAANYKTSFSESLYATIHPFPNNHPLLQCIQHFPLHAIQNLQQILGLTF